MSILIACDKFKGSLNAQEVCQSIANGITDSNPDTPCILIPMADGGDGTMELLQSYKGLQPTQIQTIDPLGRPINASYYTDNQTAYIELATASGIIHLNHDELNPMITHNIGTGHLIAHAISEGYQNIVLSIGGSCTTEAGLSIAHSLGYLFLDKSGKTLIPCGGNLSDIMIIKAPTLPLDINLTILCDVDNPLYGPNGAAHVYGPQKGATLHQIERLNRGLAHISKIIHSQYDTEISKVKGGGAAGGIAAGLHGLLDATLLSGFDYLADLMNLEEQIKKADEVISGEGLLDTQSLQGKVVGSISQLCMKHKTPLIVLAGDSLLTTEELNKAGISKVYTIMENAINLEDAMGHARKYLELLGRSIF